MYGLRNAQYASLSKEITSEPKFEQIILFGSLWNTVLLVVYAPNSVMDRFYQTIVDTLALCCIGLKWLTTQVADGHLGLGLNG